jgi:translation elongation factor EF-Tu-like GTPase
MWFLRPKKKPPAPVAFPLDMPIDDAFRMKFDDLVVVVGIIAAGEIKVGMQLRIQTPAASIPVTVAGLEGGLNNSIDVARVGNRVSVLLRGANKDQVAPGSRLVSA